MSKTTIPTDRTVSYVSQYRKCGKPRCRCNSGERHGPYIYAEWKDDDKKTKLAYVGKANKEKTTI